MLIDSHCHLNLIDYEKLGSDLNSAVDAAKQNGIEHLLCVATTLEQFPDILKIAEDYSMVSASVGLHPNELVECEPTVEQLVDLAQHPKVVAIGETGLDYFRTEKKSDQQQRFIVHINAAKQTKKPLIIHTREAKADTLSILKAEHAEEALGVMHCFTEDWEAARLALDLGFYISFSGIVTFKNAKTIQETARYTPLDRILVETDSPYLAPVPYRGKINQPAYVKEVAQFVADLKGVSYAALAEQTTANFYRLFSSALKA